MSRTDFDSRGVGDPRLAIHAVSALPAWLWSVDGTRVLWANPVGARVFGVATAAALAAKSFGPADQHRRQVVQLAKRLPAGATRLERLRGFGAALGALVTCGCARLDFADGGTGILIVAAEPVGRSMPLVERLQRLVEGIDTPIAAFARDGMFVGASDAARALLGFRNLSDAGLDMARSDALRQGRVETPIGIGHVILQRVGSGSDVGLVALLAPGPAMTPAMPAPTPVTSPEESGAVQPAAAPTGTIETKSNDALLTKTPETTEPIVESPSHTSAAETPVSEEVEASAQLAEATEPHPLADLPQPELADYEEPALLSEAPAEFALADEFADEVATAAAAPAPIASEATLHEPAPAAIEPAPVNEPVMHEPAPVVERRHPLRFVWRIDRAGLFSIASDEFTRLIGPRAASRLGQPWQALADATGLDPDGRVARALASQDTWSGIVVDWPTDGGVRLPVELSGLPVYEAAQGFAGYRGFGVCRDLDAMTRAAAAAVDRASPQPAALSADIVQSLAASPADDAAPPATAFLPPGADIAASATTTTEQDPTVETPPNVVPFRPTGDLRPPVLTPVENSAFNELARQLSARLDHDDVAAPEDIVVEPAPETPTSASTPAAPDADASTPTPTEPAPPRPDWLTPTSPAPQGETKRDRPLFDLLPGGVLIYRLDRLLYANPAFLRALGHDSLHALEEAGGLDALMVEPGVSAVSSTSDTGTPVTISAADDAGAARPRIDANLFTIDWDGEPAHALLCMSPRAEPVAAAAIEPAPPQAGQVDAEELGAILDTAAEGIVMFDADGRIHACNRSAEALFGYSGEEMIDRTFADLFAPESWRAVSDYFEGVKNADLVGLLDHGREALGRVREGGLIPLSLTMGRTRPDGPNFFVVFRDLSQVRKSESDLQQARRLAERAAGAKADVLARISHDVRTPLNAIIGFAEVMIDERFGALGNERYIEYMKDIRASGERVIAIINDLLDLSQIETGKLNLSFASQNLNDLVEQCVAVMQPQANRERIIIRTSLAHTLPPVTADARALRQVTLNLIGNSIHLANAGGQVIVSTAVSDANEVVLRVRDTGHGMNDNEVAAAMEPFRTPAPEDRTSRNSAVSLSLTKALVEANRARFAIKATSQGTLVEVTFAQVMAGA